MIALTNEKRKEKKDEYEQSFNNLKYIIPKVIHFLSSISNQSYPKLSVFIYRSRINF